LKAVILAGGKGTRISEESITKPKPLVEASGHPLLWHIMQNYSLGGVSEFIILAGYKGNQIKEYFSNYWMINSDITFDLSTPNRQIHEARGLPWKVTVLDTGIETMTGGRLAKAHKLIDDTFFMTYGDGVCDINVTELLAFHNSQNLRATLTAVQPPARFGALDIADTRVNSFEEKPTGDGSWINGGYFVLEPSIFNFNLSDETVFESDVLPKLAAQGELSAFKYEGFWQPVDTLRDLHRLEDRIRTTSLPWLQ
jgi:glucose-1-phosphate cytidylyltransferase